MPPGPLPAMLSPANAALDLADELPPRFRREGEDGTVLASRFLRVADEDLRAVSDFDTALNDDLRYPTSIQLPLAWLKLDLRYPPISTHAPLGLL